MYPVIRMAKELLKFARAEPLSVTGTHVSHHRCWPWDIDLWRELNNGRTLTLYDLARIPLAQPHRLKPHSAQKSWGVNYGRGKVSLSKPLPLCPR